MRNPFSKLAKNAFIAVVIIIVNLLSYYSNIRTGFSSYLMGFGISNGLVADTILLVLAVVATILVLLLFDCIARHYLNSRLMSYQSEPRVTFSPDGSAERLHDYQSLRVNARESIYVMGIGMTYFSNDLKLLDRLLEENINVRLLIMDPDVIGARFGDPDVPIAMTKLHFDEYFRRIGYTDELSASMSRLVTYIEERKNIYSKQGHIELRKYRTLMPINYTIVDQELKSGKLLIEMVIPRTYDRMRICFNNQEHRNIFQSIVEDTRTLWDTSERVIDDAYSNFAGRVY